MKKFKFPVIVVTLLTFFLASLAPAASVSAASLTDLLSQSTAAVSADTGSGSGGNTFVNILLGLLLGNFLSKLTNTSSDATSDIAKILGGSSSSGSSSGSTSTAKGDKIIETAKTLIGVPYVFGGNSVTTGLDCSSYTQYVMKQNGITIPRTAAEQFATGTPVEKSNLKTGDLVFFETYKKGASHVGIYMGDGNFIHESSALGQVGISALNEQYYTEHYLGARRYIK